MTVRRPARIGLDAHLLSFAGSVPPGRGQPLRRGVAARVRGRRWCKRFARVHRVCRVGARATGLPAASCRRAATLRPQAACRPHTRRCGSPGSRSSARWRPCANALDLIHGRSTPWPLGAPVRGVITIHDPRLPGTSRDPQSGQATLPDADDAARGAAGGADHRQFRPSRAMRSCDDWGCPSGKVVVVHNGVDATFAPLPPGEGWRASWRNAGCRDGCSSPSAHWNRART